MIIGKVSSFYQDCHNEELYKVCIFFFHFLPVLRLDSAL